MVKNRWRLRGLQKVEKSRSPGRVGAAEKLCENRKSIEKLCEKEHSTQWRLRAKSKTRIATLASQSGVISQ